MNILGIEIHRMGKSNPTLHFWYDVKIGSYWYVVSWRKGSRPYAYRSNDGTPPMKENNGKWFFGMRYGLRD